MRKFKFRMQPVLEVREAQRDACRIDLAKAREEFHAEEQKLFKLERQISDALDPDRRPAAVNGFFFLQRERYVKRLKDARRVQEYRVNEARYKVEAALTRLKESMTEVKKMEKCKDRDFASWNVDFKRDEQKANDEIASSRAHIQRLVGCFE